MGKQIKLTRSQSLVLVGIALVALLLAEQTSATSAHLSRQKRQAAIRNRQVVGANDQQQQNQGGNRVTGSMTMSASGSGVSMGGDDTISGSMSAATPSGKPGANTSVPDDDVDAASSSDTEVEPPKATKPSKRPARKPTRRPRPTASKPQDDYDESCDDSDEDSDYGEHPLGLMSSNPMRQFKRLMNNAFDYMQDASHGYGGGYYDGSQGRDLTRASSNAFARGDGFSRISSSVSSNGRTKGIISETRNGQTKFRRIDSDRRHYDDDDDDEES